MNLCCSSGTAGVYKAKLDSELAQREWAEYQARLAAEEAEREEIMEEKNKENGQCAFMVATTFFPFLGIIFTGLFWWVCSDFPMLPAQFEDVDWGQRWLFTAIIDYYTIAACLVGIMLASETCIRGLVWSSLILSLGAPFACLYLVSRVCKHGNLSLLTMKDSRFLTPRGTDSGAVTGYVSGFYIVAGCCFALRLFWTQQNFPLWPAQQDDTEWLTEWILTTVGDYVAIAACLCGIIYSTESTFMATVWSLVVFAAGGAGACAYLTYRAIWFNSITLQRALNEW